MPRQLDTPGSAGLLGDDPLDAALLQRITHGDRAAFHDLYTRYYHPLLRFLYRMTNDLEAAQEGINDVMFIVWEKSASFAGRSKVSTWILGIAYHKALKHRQKSKVWTERFKAAELTDSIELSSNIRALTDNLELEDLLEHGMKALSAKHRAVVELTYFYGCSYEEIAEVMDCPVNTVKTRMFHAREKLRRILGDSDKSAVTR